MKSLIILVGVAAVLLFALAHFSKPPENLGAIDGTFPPCPDAKNCVSSQAVDETHAVAPIEAAGQTDAVMKRLADAVASMPGAAVVQVDGPYLWAEFTSKVFRFVDDLECFHDQSTGRIHVRSASRVGYYDFDANRVRVETLRRVFAELDR